MLIVGLFYYANMKCVVNGDTHRHIDK